MTIEAKASRAPARSVGGSALDRILETATAEDPCLTPMKELAALRLEAAREVFALRRPQIKVLDQRATDTGVTDIKSEADIVPLLFSHTTYKSYPASFVAKGQWKRLLQWFGTLSAIPVDNVNVEDVKDIDEFIERLWAARHLALTTSGTSGKVSFLHRIAADHDFWKTFTVRHHLWPEKPPLPQVRHWFQMAPKSGPYMMMACAPSLMEMYGRPSSVYYLTEEPLKVSYLMRAAEMRLKMAEGTATPDEISAFERGAKEQAAKAMAEFERIADRILEVRHEPLYLMAQWGMMWRLLEKARAKGIPDGDFNRNSIVGIGGGLKGLKLPPDYEAQARQFLGPVHMPRRYGMSEMSMPANGCEAGRYHFPAWIIPLILDARGETLLDHHGGLVEGRFAFMDLSFHARWGGLISGDKVTMDFAEHCPCGRPGPTLLKISRYSDLGEEDKIGCAGTIEAYIKGALES